MGDSRAAAETRRGRIVMRIILMINNSSKCTTITREEYRNFSLHINTLQFYYFSTAVFDISGAGN